MATVIDQYVGGPTLDHITELKCPNGTYHKCLPYGECYDFQSYCSDKSRSVNSCFPDHILGNNESLLAWCREQITNNTTQRPHPACKLACVDKFGIAALYQQPPCQNENCADYTWAIWAAGLAISVILNILLLVLLYKVSRRRNPSPIEAATQADNNQITRNNSKDEVEIEGPADPPSIDALETDINRNRSAFNDRNVPFNIELDGVQDSSTTNTQNGAPVNQHDPAQGRRTNTQNGAPVNQHDPAQGRRTNTQNGAPINQHDPAQGRRTNTQNGAPMNQHDPAQGRRTNTQNEALINQHDPAQGRRTNTQNGAPMNQHDPAQGRRTNTQNGAPINQHDPAQGRRTNTQNGAPMNQHDPAQSRSTNTQNGAPTMLTPIDQSTINIQSGEARYNTQPRDSVASARPRRDYDDTSAESLALIPRNHAAESGDDISPVQTPTDLSIHTSTTIPGADGRHLVVTNFATYE